jgi:cytochrome c biogenesis protein CcdA
MEIIIALGSALWLGVMTSISPCPLATNIAAITFLSKKINHPLLVLLSGMAYTAGRMAAYAGLGLLLIHSLLNIPQAAQFLQKYMTPALGPVLIVTGLVLLEVIRIGLPGVWLSHKQQGRFAQAGAPGAFALGAVFALAFCPVSAALFFGSLIPLALNSKAGTGLALVYGLGTGLPVLVFAFAIAAGVTTFSRWFSRLSRIELYMRKAAGVIFILAGVYYLAVYWLKIF